MGQTSAFHPLLKRNRITLQLAQLYNFPLTLVIAAMGYGKSVAVRTYLDEIKADFIWLNIESDESSAQSLWNALTLQIADQDQKTGQALHAMGFPVTAAGRDRLFDALEEWAYQKKKVIVLDDYHDACFPELDQLIEKLAHRRIAGLHILLLSRTRPEFNIQELRLKGCCHQLKSALFELSEEEIRTYFRLFDCDLSAAAVKQVLDISEGWIAAVYLICRGYLETGRFQVDVDLQELIDSTIVRRYSDAEKKLLMSLAVFDSFTLPQAVYVTENPAVSGIIQKLSRDNSFVYFDERSQKYSMHKIFSSHLRRLFADETDQPEVRKIYRRGGEWYLKQGFLLPGIRLLLKAEDYDQILQAFEQTNITRNITRTVDLVIQDIVQVFEQIPPEVKFRHPFGYLTYIDFYLTRISQTKGAQLLAELDRHFEFDRQTPAGLKRRIAGEAELIRSFICFNDLRKMSIHCSRAYTLLDGRSQIANKDMIFTFGCPSTLFLYFRDQGDMQQMVEFAEQKFGCYEALSGGCGKGSEHLIRAEYCLETGDLEQALLLAQKAVFQAEYQDQMTVILCAFFTISRSYAANGRFMSAKDSLNELSVRVAEYNNSILLNALDLCYGYLGGITGDSNSFAPWLQNGDMKQNELFYHGLAFNYLVHAKYLLLQEHYLQLEVLCKELYQLYTMNNNLLGYLHALILDAIAQYQLYGLAKARETMQMAVNIGRSDKIVLPFAEYSAWTIDLMNALTRENANDTYLARLASTTANYRHNLKAVDSAAVSPSQLTPREKEILALLAEGLHNKDIADRLTVAEITVKKTVTSIYRKLGVSTRAAAVRVTMKSKLI